MCQMREPSGRETVHGPCVRCLRSCCTPTHTRLDSPVGPGWLVLRHLLPAVCCGDDGVCAGPCRPAPASGPLPLLLAVPLLPLLLLLPAAPGHATWRDEQRHIHAVSMSTVQRLHCHTQKTMQVETRVQQGEAALLAVRTLLLPASKATTSPVIMLQQQEQKRQAWLR